jgi:hypothetical protein
MARLKKGDREVIERIVERAVGKSPLLAALYPAEAAQAPEDELPRRDFSQSNPRLHRLYVTYAQEDLRDFAEFIERLGDRSRVNCSIMAGLIHEERAKLIRSDAAYQEAAWRLLAGAEIDPEPAGYGFAAVAADG